ncbi:MAG: D-glycero-beta-D-manno-heptose-7-phosphate kinase [Rhodospirillaceae bacterium]|nr:MAG: D-glycero-beta-D-manno-heptose-7-phosphate kinase [Rhodospirillaceae bacterium]
MALLSGFAGRRVLCVGDVMVDQFIYGDVKRISPEAPVPVVRVTRESLALGGAGNVVRNLAALGGLPYFVSVVGEDQAGVEVRRLLSELHGTDFSLRVSENRETTVKSRFFSSDGHHLLRADRETSAPLAPEDDADLRQAALAALATCDAVILSDYAKGVFGKDLAAAIIAAARAAHKPVIVDPKGTDYTRYAGATVITPNRAELAEATGSPVATDEELINAARRLRQTTGAAAILVTRADKGMTLVEDAAENLAVEGREVADVTGAGDTVVATLAMALACGARLRDAARLANVAAGIVVGRRGTAVATVAEISAALVHTGIAGFEQKIADRDSAAAKAEAWRRQSLRVGFTNGCFDLLHPGHVALLRQARGACDRLIVGLNSDASVKRLKGEGRPVQTAAARATVMASMTSVDLVVVFDEDTPQSLVEALRPDVLVKGADYARAAVVGGDFVESYGGRVVLADLVDSHSTTATIAALKTEGSGRK